MKLTDFDFFLPEKLIAQTPLKNREDSRLLILSRENQTIRHQSFKEIIDYFHPGDVLVLNDTRVIKARLYGVKKETNALIEILLLKNIEKNFFEALVKPARRVKVGTIIRFGEGLLEAKCLEEKAEGIRVFEMIYEGIFYEILDKLGEMPLPPYIKEQLFEEDRYQTTYAKNLGSAAAPTAGLHFTQEILEKIQAKGIIIAFITLHIGLGTFRPVSVENILEHQMHYESYFINQKTADVLNAAKKEKRRIIAVGTTSARTLESAYNHGFYEVNNLTNLFIYPGYQFQAIDGLLTNFHLPKSTLLMLISAFSSRELILKAYEEAIKEEYRFFSFGDAMLII